MYYYRGKDQKEIDLIIEEAGVLYPIEIKQAASVNLSMAKNMSILEKASGYKLGLKTILAQVDRNYLLAEDTLVHMIKDI